MFCAEIIFVTFNSLRLNYANTPIFKRIMFILFLFSLCKQVSTVLGHSPLHVIKGCRCIFTGDKVSRVPRDHPCEEGFWKRETDHHGHHDRTSQGDSRWCRQAWFQSPFILEFLRFFLPRFRSHCVTTTGSFPLSLQPFREITMIAPFIIRDTIHLSDWTIIRY